MRASIYYFLFFNIVQGFPYSKKVQLGEEISLDYDVQNGALLFMLTVTNTDDFNQIGIIINEKVKMKKNKKIIIKKNIYSRIMKVFWCKKTKIFFFFKVKVRLFLISTLDTYIYNSQISYI